VTDREAFEPVATGVALIEAFRGAGPETFSWREPPYEYEAVIPPIDILYGSARLREAVDAGQPVSHLADRWPEEVQPFLRIREQYLLY
jgi:uncharacterized protein YbbC (DUF1343 family)